ncbi:class A beta-lactamase [Actinosynnema sp. ALI-1.44]|uniref:class A beta-lactamase n=1 Tax=Actinosynnema sp. ALI-1.44 TaxID=1933779 RepID=UPI00097BD5D2|nr:class A beta-lactamase [Actinosynnema sp. ALI-1.44]ONI77798.1 class A beta-lactamase [Actinosynnema sp. ALI-1.44]
MQINRRTLLTALATVPLAGCGSNSAQTQPGATPTSGVPAYTTDFAALEKRFDARLGLFAVDVTTRRTVGHREEERFAICSVFKGYAAGALLKANPLSSGFFKKTIKFAASDLVDGSPVTSTRVQSGMTVAELCHAAITRSDNTAGNQMLKLLGGPTKLTEFARSIGDPMTRLDRWETALNVVPRGTEQDTTTPSAIAKAYQMLVVGDTLGAPERQQLKDWLVANTTGGERIRAGLPPTWVTGDKTGTGSFAAANDVAVTWPSPDKPIVIAVLTDKAAEDAKYDSALLAEATKVAIKTLQ